MSPLGRREFLATGAAAMAGATWMSAADAEHLPLHELPNFCAHEHWGSFDAIGPATGGFRADAIPGATPTRRVDVLDLLLDPYFGGMLGATGFNARQAAKDAGHEEVHAWWRAAPAQVLETLRKPLQQQLLTGCFQCTSRGIEMLHGHALHDLKLGAWQAADRHIGESYGDIFGWYKHAMNQMRFSGLVRPMQPEYFLADFDTPEAREECAFTQPLVRVDPLLKMWQPEEARRVALGAALGVDPTDAAGWRAFIGALFDRAAAHGALGTKQLQAYARDLDFVPREDGEVVWRGALEPAQVRVFQDWVMNECFAQAEARGWLHQVHVGTHNLDDSTPLPLERTAKRFPKLPIIMIHCWPFVEEAGWLARQVNNLYIDSCWQPVLSPDFFGRSLDTWLEYVPLHKLMLSHDATSIEMAAGSALFTRELLGQALRKRRRALGGRKGEARVALALLHGNAASLYGGS